MVTGAWAGHGPCPSVLSIDAASRRNQDAEIRGSGAHVWSTGLMPSAPETQRSGMKQTRLSLKLSVAARLQFRHVLHAAGHLAGRGGGLARSVSLPGQLDIPPFAQSLI